MKRAIAIAGFFAFAAIGCASSTELENQSRVHSLRADAAAQVRDYNRAAKEKEEAQNLHEKAVHRAEKEGRAPEVVVPADVPAPENP
jgi:sRNA-binding protein